MIIQQKIGQLPDFDVTDRMVDWLELEWYETNRRILTKQTVHGVTLSLRFLQENPQYTEGDVLLADDSTIIAIRILPCDAIVLKPRNVLEIAAVCYEIGNKHLPLFVDGDDLLVPFEMPLFNLLVASDYVVLKEKRKLLKQLKTTVLPHFSNGGPSLFSKTIEATTTGEF